MWTKMIVGVLIIAFIGLGIMVAIEMMRDPLQPIESKINATSNDGPELQRVTKMIHEQLEKERKK